MQPPLDVGLGFLPLPLLFHASFREALLTTLLSWLSGLGWYEELPRRRPLNRKLLWVYDGFIVGIITSFGVLLLRLHPLILTRETGALQVVGLVALFWTARLVVDAIVFEHSDWPEGPEIQVFTPCPGHSGEPEAPQGVDPRRDRRPYLGPPPGVLRNFSTRHGRLR